jgi:hypothetical protein
MEKETYIAFRMSVLIALIFGCILFGMYREYKDTQKSVRGITEHAFYKDIQEPSQTTGAVLLTPDAEVEFIDHPDSVIVLSRQPMDIHKIPEASQTLSDKERLEQRIETIKLERDIDLFKILSSKKDLSDGGFIDNPDTVYTGIQDTVYSTDSNSCVMESLYTWYK